MPSRRVLLGIGLPLVVVAGGAAAFGASRVLVAAVVITVTTIGVLWVRSVERVVALLFVGAMFNKLIAIISGFSYFPVVFDAALALSVGAALLRTPRHQPPVSVSATATAAWVIFFATAIVQLLNPNVPSALAAAQGFRATAFESLAFWLGVRAFLTHSELQRLFKWMLAIGLVLLANGIRQLIWPLPFDTQFIEAARSGPEVFQLTERGLGQRAFSIFPSPFTLGYFGALMAILAAYLAKATGRLKYWPASFFAAFGAVASLTRSTVFSLVGGFAVMVVVWEPGYLRRIVRVTAALGVLIAFIFLVAQVVPPIGILLAVTGSPLSEPHFVDRLSVWREVWPAIWRQPVVAYGVGSAGDALGDLYFGTDSFHIVPHNVALKLLLELGVVGTIAFGVMLAAAAGRAISSLDKDRDLRLLAAALLGGITTVLVQGITGSAIEAYPTNMYFWFLLGVASRLSATEPRALAGVDKAFEPATAPPPLHRSPRAPSPS